MEQVVNPVKQANPDKQGNPSIDSHRSLPLSGVSASGLR